MSLQLEVPEPAAPAGASPVRAGERRGVLRNIYLCYFFSGALGLIYQVLWLRKLLLVFGSTVHAVSTVLTVFFGGLALGSWLFGRLIDRRRPDAGLRWYALLELGADGVLMNTAIAAARHPAVMARAMRLAVEAGRLAYEAGRMEKRSHAAASSPAAGAVVPAPEASATGARR